MLCTTPVRIQVYKCGFPKLGIPFLRGEGGLYHKDHNILLSILGSPYLGTVPNNTYIGPLKSVTITCIGVLISLGKVEPSGLSGERSAQCASLS